jgi:hypothetical protein
MRDDPAVIALVARAADGGQGAWDAIVERYAPLLWSVCTRYRLRPDECMHVLRASRRRNQLAWTTLDDESHQYPDSVRIEEEIIAAERGR